MTGTNSAKKTRSAKRMRAELADRFNIKKPKTSWICFSTEKRKEMSQEELKDCKFGDVCKNLASTWKEMSEEDKAPYTALHLADKQRFEHALAELTEEELAEYKNAVKAKRVEKKLHAKKPSRCKRPKDAPMPTRSAYLFFAAITRSAIMAEFSGITFQDVGRELGKRWKALSDEEKKPFQDMFFTDKKRYELEMNARDV